VLSDSRCPFSVLCFWQGIAEIEVKLDNKAGDSALVTLGVLGGTRYNTENPYFIDTLGYRLSFLRLDPYPETSGNLRLTTPPVPLSEYQATMVLTHSTGQKSPVEKVTITDVPPESVQISHFSIDTMSIAGDTLDLAVTYGGGCKNHYFFLFMSPATFAESIPVQANLWLRHFDNNDSCKCKEPECLIHRHLRFDISPIADRCREMYGRPRPITLNVFRFVGQYPEARQSIPYMPAGADDNRSPIVSISGGAEIDSIAEGSVLVLTVVAEDPDSNAITVRMLSKAPSNSSFTGSNGRYVFRFTPSYTQSGTYPIQFMATDGDLADTGSISVIVMDAGNQLPRWLGPVWPSEVTEGKILRCPLRAYDPDAKKLYLTAENLPNNCTFVDSGNGRAGFVFFPDSSEIGTHVITFIATDDSGAVASMDNSITVNKWVNQKPKISVYRTNSFVAEGDTLVIDIGTSDVDGGVPSLSVLNLPPNATFTYANRGAGRVDFHPVAGQAGRYHILCIACDAWDSLLCDTLNISVTVQAVTQNQGPLIPMAVGNYWVYGNALYQSSLFDSVRIVSPSVLDGEIWWDLSPAVLFGQRLRSSGDSVFNEYGLQLIAASDTTVFFPVGPGFLRHSDAAGSCQVTRLPENVTVPAGTFANCYRYRRHCSGGDSSHFWFSNIELIVAPGVGVIRAVWDFDTGPYAHMPDYGAFQLERYQLR
jgi:hypothetical protein